MKFTGDTTVTAKQQRFVEEYLCDLNATQAAIRAGYSVKTARSQGQRLLTKVDITAAIESAQAKRSEKVELTAEWVLLALKENHARAMQHNAVLVRKGEPTGEYMYQGSVANRALELIGKHLGMFVERHEVDVLAHVNVPPSATTYEEWVRQNEAMEEATGIGLHSVPAEHAELAGIPDSGHGGL